MSKKVLVPINLLAVSADPAGDNAGDIYYNSIVKSLKVYDGTVWVTFAKANYGFAEGGAVTSVYGAMAPLDGGAPATTSYETYTIDGGGV